MNTPAYNIRNYRPADFNEYVRLKIAAEKLEPTGRCTSPRLLGDYLARPNYSPEQDLFVIENTGSLVGYMDSTPELTIGRVVLSCWVHPDHRRRGLASGLLGHALRRARESGARAAHININEDNSAAKIVLTKFGFSFARKFLNLGLDLSAFTATEASQAIGHYRHLRHGEEGELTRIQNRCFAGAWGYNPNTITEISYRLKRNNCSPEDVILAGDGDRISAYCWMRLIADGKEGQIFMLGVDPDYRGKLLGRGLLQAGLSYLKGKGAKTAKLTVDSNNKTALALYQSLGFRVRAGSLWYEKALD
ncbi:GNAT family N-acetyltransferase [Chloroflexota bacterium]